jgi:hypothetical protein
MSYHLTAYSPWEGYRVMFNGTGGRLELEVEESMWQPPREVEIPEFDHAGHGGGDARMLRALFDGDDGSAPTATAVDGALALATGLAANTAFARGEPVDIDDVVRMK